MIGRHRPPLERPERGKWGQDRPPSSPHTRDPAIHQAPPGGVSRDSRTVPPGDPYGVLRARVQGGVRMHDHIGTTASSTGAGRVPSAVQLAAPVVSLALDGRVLDANEALCRLIGQRRADLVGRPLDALSASPSDVLESRRALAAARAGTPCGGFTQHWTDAGRGAPRPLRLVWELVRDPRGTPASMTATCVDVARERAADLAAARIRALFEQSAVPQVVWDTEGKLTEANPAFCELVRRGVEDLVGLPARDLLHRSDIGLGGGPDGLLPPAGDSVAGRVLARSDSLPLPAIVSG